MVDEPRVEVPLGEEGILWILSNPQLMPQRVHNSVHLPITARMVKSTMATLEGLTGYFLKVTKRCLFVSY
jgi:hypothetical protein